MVSPMSSRTGLRSLPARAVNPVPVKPPSKPRMTDPRLLRGLRDRELLTLHSHGAASYYTLSPALRDHIGRSSGSDRGEFSADRAFPAQSEQPTPDPHGGVRAVGTPLPGWPESSRTGLPGHTTPPFGLVARPRPAAGLSTTEPAAYVTPHPAAAHFPAAADTPSPARTRSRAAAASPR